MDTREKNVTKEKAIQLASNAMIQAFATFLKNGKYADGSYTSNKTLAEIKQRINSISYQDETTGYWILSGPYEILVDKSIEALFFKYGTKAVSGSYMEGITPVDVNDMDVFARGYFLGWHLDLLLRNDGIPLDSLFPSESLLRKVFQF